MLRNSFRDPSGFVFTRDGVLYRQVNSSYREQFDTLVNSGLYSDLVEDRLLVPHTEVSLGHAYSASDAYKVIQPVGLPFVSYPYEWSFSQLRDAALCTLEVQRLALKYGLILKDASGYNVQFLNGKPIFIDTLSFDLYAEGKAWEGYQQFCQHFLAPLALMSRRDTRTALLLRHFIDGVPLDLAGKLLSAHGWLSPALLIHITLHARSQKKYADVAPGKPMEKRHMPKKALISLIDHLQSTIRNLQWKPKGTEWADYYDDDSYTKAALERKKAIVCDYIRRVSPGVVWDLGGNTGFFSRMATAEGAFTVSFDSDPAAVEKNYQNVRRYKEEGMLPLLMDLANPSPALGFAHRERQSLMERGPADMVLALALVHHMCISYNVPLDLFANFLSNIARTLVIEFVPKKDKKVQKLLTSRKDIFNQYDQSSFEHALGAYFHTQQVTPIEGSERILYLMTSNKV